MLRTAPVHDLTTTAPKSDGGACLDSAYQGSSLTSSKLLETRREIEIMRSPSTESADLTRTVQ